MIKLAVIVLAAGEGTRFKSITPKLLHKILGKPLISYVSDTIKEINAQKTVFVLGHKKKEIAPYIPQGFNTALQKNQTGTATAVAAAKKYLKDFSGAILILAGDVPLITPQTLNNFIYTHNVRKNDATVLTARLKEPFGYGRIIKENDKVLRIVEEKDASDSERKIKEINTGIYLFNSKYFFKLLSKIKNDNAKNEYYLTDIIQIYNENNLKIGSYTIEDEKEISGANNRYQLSALEEYLKMKVNKKIMLNGVTIENPASVLIEESVKIENDVTVLSGSRITGKTVIKTGCTIGPDSQLNDSLIGRNCVIKNSRLDGSSLGENTYVGPYAHLRPGTVLKGNNKIGNFVEIKKSELGEGTKVSHLTYVGDSIVGKNVNFGCGTVTCNYDGKKKHITRIGDNVFIGSGTKFIAPVKIGSNSVIAAGSVITDDVPSNSLGIARASQITKKGYYSRAAKKK